MNNKYCYSVISTIMRASIATSGYLSIITNSLVPSKVNNKVWFPAHSYFVIKDQAYSELFATFFSFY